MASKLVKKKEVKKVAMLNPFLKTLLRAQMATAAPPLGPELGKRGVNVANFCKDFNKATSHLLPGTVLPTMITVSPNRTYTFEISSPTTIWLLEQAAGIRRGAQTPGEVAGKLSVKHIYEIAKLKSNDKNLVGVPLKDICQMMMRTAHSVGIEVQHEDLDPVEYKAFLDERRQVVAEQLKEWADKKASKVLRS